MRYPAVVALLFLSVMAVYPEASQGAGFASSALFLSKSPAVEGDSIRIFAVVQNEATTTFAGKLVIADGDTILGSPAVSLTAGSAQTVSVAWKPAAGTHTVSAQLFAQGGSVAGKESRDFIIAAKPKPVPASTGTSSQPAASIDSSKNIRDAIGRYSPAVEGAVAPVFKLIDGGRQAASDALDRGIAWGKATVGDKSAGEVIGSTLKNDNAQDPAGAAGGAINTLWFVLATLLLYVFSILQWLVGSAGIFYPIFAVAVLYILWKLIRRVRARP